MAKCDTCDELATHGVHDYRERAGVPRGEWREFEEFPEKRGCKAHPVASFTTYLDGRVIRTAAAVPEKVI